MVYKLDREIWRRQIHSEDTVAMLADMEGGEGMEETKTAPSETTLWQELNRKAVLLNKWTQRTMYTLQTTSPKSPVDLDRLIGAMDTAILKVIDVCEEVS